MTVSTRPAVSNTALSLSRVIAVVIPPTYIVRLITISCCSCQRFTVTHYEVRHDNHLSGCLQVYWDQVLEVRYRHHPSEKCQQSLDRHTDQEEDRLRLLLALLQFEDRRQVHALVLVASVLVVELREALLVQRPGQQEAVLQVVELLLLMML